MSKAKRGSEKSGPRSGPSGKNLGVAVMFRANDEQQKARWQKAAERAGLTLTEWLRRLADEAADPKVARFLALVEKAVSDTRVSEDDLVELVYSTENPLLAPSPVGGAPLVTKEAFLNPVYRVLCDLLERKRIEQKTARKGK